MNHNSTFSGPGYVVIDDFLTPEQQQFVWHYVQDEKYKRVHTDKWVKAFRLTDNEPLQGPVYLSDCYPPDTQSQIYPSGQAIDLVIAELKKVIPDYVELIGAQHKDWAYFFARCYIYPADTGLSWHRDNENQVTGAFVYYAHPKWNPQWGGEFMLAPYETKHLKYPTTKLYNGEERYLGSHITNDFEKQVLMEHSVGTYILPKPNRLILMTSGIIHAIKKVDQAAGHHIRASIQGFFQDPKKILQNCK